MTRSIFVRRVRLGAAAALGVLIGAAGCRQQPSDRIQGYVEGEFVYVASPFAGALQTLSVQRGDQVQAGDPLFALDELPERAAREQAERRLIQARADLTDLQKGRRPSEIAAIEAQLAQARSGLEFSEKEYTRLERLMRSEAAAALEFERARTARDQQRQRVTELEAELTTARLAARPDQIEAAQAHVRALEAALTQAEWNLAEKRQAAPQSGLVFDTLYRQGEWVAAGRPVVALLPPANIKVRGFVPEPRIGAIQVGDTVRVHVDHVAVPFVGKVSFISPRAEYTPPVIYSNETRAKLVFMIEATFEPQVAVRLHPGQPVDVVIAR